MKRIRIILSVAFILGLVFFQVKLVAENDRLNLQADISLSQKANANPEWFNPESPTGHGIFTPNPQSINCEWNQIDTWEYWDYDMGREVLVGTKVKINGVIQYPFYNGPYAFVKYIPSTEQIMGQLITCEAGNKACTPATLCP